tara:strand:- start:387 stop:515 length:129 start_codon:yes stop_codon:yes gene_type:complete
MNKAKIRPNVPEKTKIAIIHGIKASIILENIFGLAIKCIINP